MTRGSVRRLILGAWLALAPSGTAATQPPCAVGTPIPAYAHNDYENPRPLLDALDLGFQGAEADVHLVRGMLLVAHDRHAVRPGRTLEALYLAPLRARVARCGAVLPGGRPFLLNIEAKTPGLATYRALVRMLRRYRDLLTVVRDGRVEPGPVQVVLVGWHPRLDALAAEPERLVAIQWYADDPDGVPDAPAHLLRLVSVDFGKRTGWHGAGPPPEDVGRLVAALVAARDAVPGRIARAHNVPVNAAVYQLLLDGGVDLIGSEDLPATRGLLAGP